MSAATARPPAPPGRGAPLTLFSSRCISCASNRWTCQWDLRYHECREASPNPEDGIIRAHMVRSLRGARLLSHGQAAPDQPSLCRRTAAPSS